MKTNMSIATGLALGILTLAGCTVEQEQEGQLPEYEQTQEGRLPEFDVDPARVEIGTDTQVVETPDIDLVPTDTASRP